MKPVSANLLDKQAFLETFKAPMRDVTQEATDVIDIWPYVQSVPAQDLENHQIYEQYVEVVYRCRDGLFDHVLVMTRTKNIYVCVVIDLENDQIHGHYLLDLNREYGVSE